MEPGLCQTLAIQALGEARGKYWLSQLVQSYGSGNKIFDQLVISEISTVRGESEGDVEQSVDTMLSSAYERHSETEVLGWFRVGTWSVISISWAGPSCLIWTALKRFYLESINADWGNGAGGIRTPDTADMSRLLLPLSYTARRERRQSYLINRDFFNLMTVWPGEKLVDSLPFLESIRQ